MGSAQARLCPPYAAAIAGRKRAIQYAAASQLKHWRLRSTVSHARAGDDTAPFDAHFDVVVAKAVLWGGDTLTLLCRLNADGLETST
jgi:hypothetical protein